MKNGRHLSTCVLAAAWLLTPAGAARADRIYFKNGRSIEGIIQEERDDAVVLGLGLGSMTIKRGQIDRIERDGNAANADQHDKWRERYYLHEKYVPPGLEPLSAAFRDLKTARKNAVNANKTLRAADQEQLALNRQMADVTKARKAVSSKIAAAQPERNIRAYNALVARHNTLAAESALLRGKLQTSNQRRGDASNLISAYANKLLSFKQQFDKAGNARPPAGQDEATEYFLAQVGKELTAYEGDFLDADAEVSRRGNSTFVQTIVNGKRRGRFLVDTGATLVALSRSFAGELGLQVDAFPETDVVVADGRQVKAKQVLLKSVRVGRTTIENVRAVVMPGEVQEDVDGLLGMSFLRHFNVRLGNGGRLNLDRFAPD